MHIDFRYEDTGQWPICLTALHVKQMIRRGEPQSTQLLGGKPKLVANRVTKIKEYLGHSIDPTSIDLQFVHKVINPKPLTPAWHMMKMVCWYGWWKDLDLLQTCEMQSGRSR